LELAARAADLPLLAKAHEGSQTELDDILLGRQSSDAKQRLYFPGARAKEVPFSRAAQQHSIWVPYTTLGSRLRGNDKG
jgi:hypothetical protein